MSTPVHCEVVASDSVHGVRRTAGFESNPLLHSHRLFRLRVTNTSGRPLAFLPCLADPGGMPPGEVDAEVLDEQGGFVGNTSHFRSTLSFSLEVSETPVSLPAPGTVYWAAGETAVKDLRLSPAVFARLDGARDVWAPGRYQVRGTFTYSPAPGEVLTVKSAPVWVAITADHIAEFQKR